MKKPILSFLFVALIMLSFFHSCQQEVDISPMVGKASFSLSQLTRDDGRVNETSRLPAGRQVPAFVLLSIKDSAGKEHGDVKLSLIPFGQSYISEDLELQTGNYQLTQFEVLDSSDKIVYASPLEGSDLAKYVTDPLPMAFTIKNEGTRVIPQVVPVLAEQDPRSVNLNINLQYPAIAAFDSAYIVFTNSTSELKLKLTLNNESHIATGRITVPSGDWNISTSYYSTIIRNLESSENKGVVDLLITSTATDLISNGVTVYINDTNAPIRKSFTWIDYYYYYLFLNNKYEGFVRLPKDPLNPFIEISAYNPKWIYAYADRSFYNRSLDGSSNYFQGGGAFEVYYDLEDIIDTVSFAPGISELSDKVWTYADGLIILEDNTGENELLIYHVWDLRTSNGRIKSSSTTWSKAEMDKRKRFHLK